jgi:hypothetical protein
LNISSLSLCYSTTQKKKQLAVGTQMATLAGPGLLEEEEKEEEEQICTTRHYVTVNKRGDDHYVFTDISTIQKKGSVRHRVILIRPDQHAWCKSVIGQKLTSAVFARFIRPKFELRCKIDITKNAKSDFGTTVLVSMSGPRGAGMVVRTFRVNELHARVSVAVTRMVCLCPSLEYIERLRFINLMHLSEETLHPLRHPALTALQLSLLCCKQIVCQSCKSAKGHCHLHSVLEHWDAVCERNGPWLLTPRDPPPQLLQQITVTPKDPANVQQVIQCVDEVIDPKFRNLVVITPGKRTKNKKPSKLDKAVEVKKRRRGAVDEVDTSNFTPAELVQHNQLQGEMTIRQRRMHVLLQIGPLGFRHT